MRHKYWLLFLVGILGLSLFPGCAPAAANERDLMADTHPIVDPVPAEPVSPAYAQAMARFGWDLLRVACADRRNVLLSPASVHIALAMTLNGADADTRAQMLALLGSADLADAGELNRAARQTLARWNAPAQDARLTIANSIWFDQGLAPDPDFLQINADYYAAAARKLDFQSPAALKAINGWIREATRGVIPTILDQLPASAVMYLINAIHFQADWQAPFDPAGTHDRTFHAPDGDVEASFMQRLGTMRHLERADWAGVLLPYQGERFAFFALLPREGVSPREWLAGRERSDLPEAVTSLLTAMEQSVQLALPRFEVSYSAHLQDALAALGMTDAFDAQQADFSRLQSDVGRGLYISDVLHKTFCRVDEKGTEAAAVTAIEVRDTGMPVIGRELVLDRPFLYGIVDCETGVPLFLGILDSPAAG